MGDVFNFATCIALALPLVAPQRAFARAHIHMHIHTHTCIAKLGGPVHRTGLNKQAARPLLQCPAQASEEEDATRPSVSTAAAVSCHSLPRTGITAARMSYGTSSTSSAEPPPLPEPGLLVDDVEGDQS